MATTKRTKKPVTTPAAEGFAAAKAEKPMSAADQRRQLIGRQVVAEAKAELRARLQGTSAKPIESFETLDDGAVKQLMTHGATPEIKRDAAAEWNTRMDELFLQIARETISSEIETLATRNSDRLDFREVSVASLREAMARAYEAGVAAGKAKRGW